MVYNNTNKEWGSSEYLTRGIVYICKNYIEFGYFKSSPDNVPILHEHTVLFLDNINNCIVPIYWNNAKGVYVLNSTESNNIIIDSKQNFFYPIKRCYNFSKLDLIPRPYADNIDKEFLFLKGFTFGLEYETSGGNIPWLDCLKYNLVPLYDGSIRGHEYVTFPLQYNELSVIQKHLRILECYTVYDKDCSLHIHIGGFPITYDKIEALCKSWNHFQKVLGLYIPEWSYYVERYKSNGKAYNKVFPKILKLNSFYEKFTGNVYIDEKSFLLDNKHDMYEERKWEVHGRYFNMNIMHLISGKEHKTVEFRFLRPTTNYYEIKWYLLVLAAFVKYVKDVDNIKYGNLSLENILYHTYSENITHKLLEEGEKLYQFHKHQINYRDYAGLDKHLNYQYLHYIRNFNI